MLTSIGLRYECRNMIVWMVTMLRTLVTFACFVSMSSIIYDMLVLDACVEPADKFFSSEASTKGIVLTKLVM